MSRQTTPEFRSVGAAIRSARLAAGMTQRALAKAVHVTPPYLCQVERGRYSPSAALVARAATALRGDFVTYFKRRD